jgi:uncharacterized protein
MGATIFTMSPDLMEILVCPVCKGELELEATKERDDGEVVEGTIRCAACNEKYPIEDGIPNMLPPDMRES